MGRRLLLSLGAVVALSGCTAVDAVQVTDQAHRGVECADCHTGPRADAEMASAPTEGCTASGCHEDRGPGQAEIREVSFEHRDHGGDSVAVVSGCAGCHTHAEGGAPLQVSMASCSLCHISDAAKGNAAECRLCHTAPEQVTRTSQEVAIPHREVPWIDGGCVRCHYDVSPVAVQVSILSCATCHQDPDSVASESAGTDPHPDHTGVACTSCHQEQTHRIERMSTAVVLQCGDCHADVHGVEPTPAWPGTSTCNACHARVHAPEQALLLGMVAQVPGSSPSAKFLDGLSCRSCHVPPASHDPTESVDGSEAGCVGCHRTEYGQVLEWWRDGAQARITPVRRALDRAETRLEGNAAARPRLDSATVALTAVEEGNPVHNLSLAHGLLERAQTQISQAYRDAGTGAPAPVELGPRPSIGLCTYCHYLPDDPWVFQEMSGDFHREALRRDVR
ncbi:MAG: cytochrome c3 family protein [Gemmatimonadota bacterium]